MIYIYIYIVYVIIHMYIYVYCICNVLVFSNVKTLSVSGCSMILSKEQGQRPRVWWSFPHQRAPQISGREVTEIHGKTMGESWGKKWENHGKTLANHGKIMKHWDLIWSNHEQMMVSWGFCGDIFPVSTWLDGKFAINIYKWVFQWENQRTEWGLCHCHDWLLEGNRLRKSGCCGIEAS